MSKSAKIREALQEYGREFDWVRTMDKLDEIYKPDQEKMPKIDEGKISELLRPLLRMHHVTRDHKTKYHYALCCYLAKEIAEGDIIK